MKYRAFILTAIMGAVIVYQTISSNNKSTQITKTNNQNIDIVYVLQDIKHRVNCNNVDYVINELNSLSSNEDEKERLADKIGISILEISGIKIYLSALQDSCK